MSSFPPFVDPATWEANRDAWVTLDVRHYLDGRDPRKEYDAGHLDSAAFVDFERWLAGAPGDDVGRAPLPDPAVFAEGMGALGVGDETTVVAYDDAGGVMAARLVWMLRATGHAAALLDGGTSAAPLVTTPVEPAPAAFTPRPWPAALLADIDEVTAPGLVLLDARPADRFAGAPDPYDPRAGHIPGARSLPCRENVGPDGRLLPVDALRGRLAAVGVDAAADVVSYCGSGVTACHNLLVLEHAGFPAGRLFPGSWSEWSRSGRPVA